MAKTRVRIMEYKKSEQIKRCNEKALKKNGLTGNKKQSLEVPDIPRHEHSPAVCKQYGCGQSKKDYERQLFDTGSYLEKRNVIKTYSSVINKYLGQTTYASSEHPYIRDKYASFKKSSEFGNLYTVSFF